MNEQIKQLAEQAGFMLWKNESWNPGDVVDWSARYDDELIKFYDLIVRECANVAADRDALDIYEEIREHFGVEE